MNRGYIHAVVIICVLTFSVYFYTYSQVISSGLTISKKAFRRVLPAVFQSEHITREGTKALVDYKLSSGTLELPQQLNISSNWTAARRLTNEDRDNVKSIILSGPKNDVVENVFAGSKNLFDRLAHHGDHVGAVVLKSAELDPETSVISPVSYNWVGSTRLCKFLRKFWHFPKGWYGAKRVYRFHHYYKNCSTAFDQGLNTSEKMWSEYFKVSTQIIQDWESTKDLIPDITTHFPRVATFLIVVNNALSLFEGQSSSTNNFTVTAVGCYHKSNSHKIPHSVVGKTSVAYDKVFVAVQHFRHGVFHIVAEQISRLVVYLPFLRANPNVLIHMEHLSLSDKILELLGINPNRLVSGNVLARTLYIPEGTPCVQVRPLQTQLLYQEIQFNAAKRLPNRENKRNLLIFIQRAYKRRRYFQQFNETREIVQRAAKESGLDFWVFDDPVPSFDETLEKFSRAAVIVGGHGAGLVNMLFAPPGTFIIEVLCEFNAVNFCFQRMAGVIGHRYYGIVADRGCMKTTNPNLNELYKVVVKYAAYVNSTDNTVLWPQWKASNDALKWTSSIIGQANLVKDFITDEKLWFSSLQRRNVWTGS